MALVSTIEVEYGDFNGCCWFSATVVYCCTTYILWLIGSALHWYIAVQVTYCDLLVFFSIYLLQFPRKMSTWRVWN